jgi:hypothetical protein
VFTTTHCLKPDTIRPRLRLSNFFPIRNLSIGLPSAIWFGVRAQEHTMQTLMTAITVTAGMAFSLAIAILVEEWIFGKVFGLFFVRQAVPVKSATER